MSSNRRHARHRAIPSRTSPFVTASRAVSAGAAAAGKPALAVVAASGILLGAALPSSAAGEISLPSGSPTTAVPAATAGTYTVRAGDSLGSIAAAHGVSLDSVFSANGLGYGSVIHPGQSIVLGGVAAPQQSTVAPAVTAAPAPATAPAATVAPAPAPAVPVQTAGNTTGLAAQSASITPTATTNLSGIAATALNGQGSGYVYGGTTFGAWDCSGFVQWVYAQHGIQLPRVTWSQFASMRPTSNPQPGDLVSQNGGGHVGIYLGNGQMISALNPAQGTVIHSVNAMSLDGYYTR